MERKIKKREEEKEKGKMRLGSRERDRQTDGKRALLKVRREKRLM